MNVIQVCGFFLLAATDMKVGRLLVRFKGLAHAGLVYVMMLSRVPTSCVCGNPYQSIVVQGWLYVMAITYFMYLLSYLYVEIPTRVYSI